MPLPRTVGDEAMTPTLTAADNHIDYEVSPERRLMLAVLTTAIMDAAGANTGTMTPRDRRHAPGHALRWIKRADGDFQWICEMADLDPREVRKCALNFINSGQELPKINRVSPSIRDARPKAYAHA